MTTKIRVFVRVARRRMAEGEDIETILADWPKLTDDEKFIEELCDIAMCGDRGILSCFPQFEFALLGTIFDEGKNAGFRSKRRRSNRYEAL